MNLSSPLTVPYNINRISSIIRYSQLEQVSESNRKRETNHLAYLLSNEAGKGTRQLQEIQRTEGSGENLQPSRLTKSIWYKNECKLCAISA